MFADDRVLVAYVPDPQDWERIVQEGWYRIPMRHAPKGVYAEWIAFYFGRKFAHNKYAIHTYARNLGHELTTRRALFPHQSNHPRADDIYYLIQLGELVEMERPIVSLRWRRLLFLHTTGDRFRDAVEINDLLLEGDDFVNRTEVALRDDATRPYVIESNA